MCGHWESMPKPLQGMGVREPEPRDPRRGGRKEKKKSVFTKLGHELMVLTVEFYGKTFGC